MKAYSFIIITLALLSGCAVGIDPGKLSEPTSQSSFYLSENISFQETRGLGAHYDITLLKGEYTATKQDAAGVYYDGPKDGFLMTIGGRELIFNGGIWLPHNTQNPSFRAYHYIKETVLTKELREQNGGYLGALTEADIKRNTGRIELWDMIADQAIIKQFNLATQSSKNAKITLNDH